jgi:transcriptional repressor NrdR
VQCVQCPKCASDDDKVVDSRAVDSGRAIRRRRACLACGNRFTTFERIEGVGLTVEKRSGDRMPFDPDKIAAGVRAACKNRPVSDEAIGGIVEGIEDRARVEGLEVLPTERIGLEVLEGLGALDQVAYLRFASVYKEFSDASDFAREARLLTKATKPKQH